MSEQSEIVGFYLEHVPGAQALPEGAAPEAVTWARAECPFCQGETQGILNVDLDPDSLFFGLFNCSALCSPPGFALEFSRRMGLSLSVVPGFDPEREEEYRPPALPHTYKDNEMHRFVRMLSDPMREPFRKAGLGDRVLELFSVGYNGRMFTFPYLQHDDHCYALRCVAFASRFEEPLWQGHEPYFIPPNNLFNAPEVARADGGAIFITVGERNALTLA